ncbi:MAG: 3-phosphoshikimate 1-carboxyvinyltransferase [Terriglobia bacterium]|nr:3-phosphoshikimate 1-carboxyvinyltransferase [Terriglobia bacterium]
MTTAGRHQGATSVAVRPTTALAGRLRVPGDKSISHRALIVGALADSPSSISGLSDGDDVARTAAALAACGASLRTLPGSPGTGPRWQMDGSADMLVAPAHELDMGNSGTGIRLLAGVVAGFPWSVRFTGDMSLRSRPMDRVADPLRRMGAQVDGRGPRCLPPLQVRGGQLSGIAYTVPVASAQVKSAVLLAALRAGSPSVVHEPIATRPHTEVLLLQAGADVEMVERAGGRDIHLRPGPLHGLTLAVPGDPSQAAFWVVAACVVPGSSVVVESVHAGPGRRGFIDVLRRMGADIEERPSSEAEPGIASDTVDLTVRPASLLACTVTADQAPGIIDEVPILAVAAALAEGTTVFEGVGELRLKESDRMNAVADLVTAFGATAEIRTDDLAVHGVDRLRPTRVDARGDHRVAMAAAVAALACPEGAGATVVDGWDAVVTSYPGFATDLARLGATMEPVGWPPADLPDQPGAPGTGPRGTR